MALSISQQQHLEKAVWRILAGTESMTNVLGKLDAAGNHEEIGTDVRAFLLQFAPLSSWVQLKTDIETFETALTMTMAEYRGDAMPEEFTQ